MRYSKEHKLETHARIVKKASVRLREKGAHGVGVADLMKEAGLTHGGFYAHFDSRGALAQARRSDAAGEAAGDAGGFLSDPGASRRSRPWLRHSDPGRGNRPRKP